MSDNGSSLSRRSSSQTSHASSESRKAKTVRGGPIRNGSKTSTKSSHQEDPALTSFPSFSPDPKESRSSVKGDEFHKPVRTVSQRVRDRKATLAGLTSASPSLDRQHALFDDSPRSSLDIPGSLHLASDEHIERLIARAGAVKLVRQYASDLAHRDAEISALRVRADNRERELKRLLREADVPTAEVEKRLLRLEQGSNLPPDAPGPSSAGHHSMSAASLDGLMIEAMADDLVARPVVGLQEVEPFPTVSRSTPSLPAEVLLNRSRADSAASAQVKASAAGSRTISRANSFISEGSQDVDATLRPRGSVSNFSRLVGLQSIFQPPPPQPQTASYFIGGAKLGRKPITGDEVSVRSTQSSRSLASWTQIFGGKSQAGRSRASSVEDDTAATKGTPSEAESSLATVAKGRTNSGPAGSRSSTSVPTTGAAKGRPVAKRTTTASRLSASPNHVRKESNASNLAPTVELDSMIESSQLPPTMTAQNNENNSGLLTDRFGFIYDQRRRKRHNLQVHQHRKNRLSGAETIASFRSSDGSSAAELSIDRPATPLSVDDEAPKKPWQDYLKVSSTAPADRPKELLSHTPSASAVVTVSTADATGTITPPPPPTPRARERSISISAAAQQALPSSSSVTEPQSSAVTATSTEFAQEADHDVTAESGSAKLLLDQLTELHDSLQAERAIKWNDFLRRVRTERASNTDRTTKNNGPEADLLNGELIGIATLGRSSKTKSKYLHFKSLVLSGIPVSLRPKIWAECSGASALRIPGYFEDLVARSQEGTVVDPDIASQIKADVRRTLTDNVFFRQGPGVQRLEELLRAYSLHNPRIGYCQGMNLITASLLLICATPEDCFWLLVAIIDHILPSGYFSGSLACARADQLVLRQYVAEVLPRLSTKLDELNVELEACTFHWFLSLYAGVLTGGEALYRVWDVILCLNSSDASPQAFVQSKNLPVDMSALNASTPSTPSTPGPREADDGTEHDGTSSPFLFQLALALLKLNETAILALDSAAQVYTYINHNMTNHAISIDALVQASEALRTRVKRSEVLERRKAALNTLGA